MSNSLLSFILSHGFTAYQNADGSISIEIPFMRADRSTGSETAIVSNMSEARDALGY